MSVSDRGQVVLSLFERYYDRVYRFARKSADAVTAEDIAQEVFSRLLDLEDLEQKHIGSSYLIKIADNVLKRRYHIERRDKAWRNDQVARGARTGVARETARADEGIERDELFKQCAQELRVLSEGEQAALGLVVCRGLSYREAANSLGVDTTAINNWRSRGLQRMRSGTLHGGPAERVVEHSSRRDCGGNRCGQGEGERASAAAHRSREAG